MPKAYSADPNIEDAVRRQEKISLGVADKQQQNETGLAGA
jgi:hypothetical protein